MSALTAREELVIEYAKVMLANLNPVDLTPGKQRAVVDHAAELADLTFDRLDRDGRILTDLEIDRFRNALGSPQSAATA